MNIKQIAKAAGVSVATVSRVLNHPESVAEPTREKVLRIMEEEGYKPNWFAQGLNSKKTRTIGLLIPNTLHSTYMEIASGVEEVAYQKGYATFMCNTEKVPEAEKEYIQQLVHRKVEGLVLMFSSLDDSQMSWIREEKIPAVIIGQNELDDSWNSVICDCRAATAQMVAHLLECGHKSVGMLCGGDPKLETKDMLIGFKNVMKASGIPAEDRHIVHVENSIKGGYLGVKKMMETGLPEALFASSDEIAFGAMDALKDAGLRIPEDVAVAGFGNDRMANLIEPKLTTIEAPLRKMGIYGARLLFDLIEDKEGERHITLQTKMRIRKSCGHKDRIGEMF